MYLRASSSYIGCFPLDDGRTGKLHEMMRNLNNESIEENILFVYIIAKIQHKILCVVLINHLKPWLMI